MILWWIASLHDQQNVLARRSVLPNVTNVSSMTFSRCLRFGFGLESFKPTRYCSYQIQASGISWVTWNLDNGWIKKVMFTDESTQKQFLIHKRIIRRLPDKGFYWKNANQIMKHHASQMVWCAIFKSGSAPLYVDHSRFLKLLKEQLEHYM